MSKNPQKNGYIKIPKNPQKKVVQKPQKCANKSRCLYECTLCDYNTSNKKDFRKHCGTIKHFTNMSNNQDYLAIKTEETQITEQTPNEYNLKIFEEKKHICEICGRGYKFKSGYYRHMKICYKKNMESFRQIQNKIKTESEVMKMLIENNETNKRLCEKLINMESNRQEQVIQNTINNNTINNNQKLSINVFLNTQCKDAMNITDFVNQLQLTLDDLIYTKNNGYVKGITKIFVKNLEEMKPTERPIHCSDKKRQCFYIKDEDKWERDKEHAKLDKTIDTVSRKQINQIKDWEAAHPNWNNSDAGTEEYMHMVRSVMGGQTDSEQEKNNKSIKKELTQSAVTDSTNSLGWNTDTNKIL